MERVNTLIQLEELAYRLSEANIQLPLNVAIQVELTSDEYSVLGTPSEYLKMKEIEYNSKNNYKFNLIIK